MSEYSHRFHADVIYVVFIKHDHDPECIRCAALAVVPVDTSSEEDWIWWYDKCLIEPLDFSNDLVIR